MIVVPFAEYVRKHCCCSGAVCTSTGRIVDDLWKPSRGLVTGATMKLDTDRLLNLAAGLSEVPLLHRSLEVDILSVLRAIFL